MLYVYTYYDCVEWHVGEKVPIVEPYYIQADGDELAVILANFQNLPHTSANVQGWTGEMAKYIMANLGFILAGK